MEVIQFATDDDDDDHEDYYDDDDDSEYYDDGDDHKDFYDMKESKAPVQELSKEELHLLRNTHLLPFLSLHHGAYHGHGYV